MMAATATAVEVTTLRYGPGITDKGSCSWKRRQLTVVAACCCATLRWLWGKSMC